MKIWCAEINHFRSGSIEKVLFKGLEFLQTEFESVTHFDTLNGANDMSAEPDIRSPTIPFHLGPEFCFSLIYRLELVSH